MRSREVIIGLVALILFGAAAWWVLLVDKDPQEGRASALSQPEVPKREVAPPSATPLLKSPVEDTVKSDSVAGLDKSPESVARGSVKWSAKALSFAAQADPDPVLSKEIEYGVKRSLDASLDYGRFDVESITCRGYTCQILSIDRTPPPVDRRPPDMQQGWGPILAKMLLQLKDAGIQNPSTGARIDKPELEELTLGGEGIVTLIRFKEP